MTPAPQRFRKRPVVGSWRVALTCCGRNNGEYRAATWEEADAFRESYTSGPAVDPHGYSGDGRWHQRSGVITYEPAEEGDRE